MTDTQTEKVTQTQTKKDQQAEEEIRQTAALKLSRNVEVRRRKNPFRSSPLVHLIAILE